MNKNGENGGSGLFMVVSAPSGTGKTSILREVLKKCPNLRFSVSCTTRPPRPGEKDGKDYYFIADDAFRERIKQGEFVEWEEYSGYLYGTSKKTMHTFMEDGFDLILDIEIRGAKSLKNQYPGGVFVFVLPPSLDELKRRLSKRGADEAVMVEKRLSRALDEIRESSWYDYIIFNDRLETAIDQFVSIYVAEKNKRERVAARIEDFFT